MELKIEEFEIRTRKSTEVPSALIKIVCYFNTFFHHSTMIHYADLCPIASEFSSPEPSVVSSVMEVTTALL